MTIHLPNELESSIQAAVLNGYFTSVDEAMARAAHLLLRELKQQPRQPADGSIPVLGSIGFMRDAADELDEIVADAYRQRRQETWREFDLE